MGGSQNGVSEGAFAWKIKNKMKVVIWERDFFFLRVGKMLERYSFEENKTTIEEHTWILTWGKKNLISQLQWNVCTLTLILR